MVSVPAAYLVFNMKANYDFLGAMADTEAKRGVNAMGDGFGEGYILPTYVVVEFDEPLYIDTAHRFNTDYLNATDSLMLELGNLSTVFKVTSSTYNTQSGLRIDRAVNWTTMELGQSLGIHNRTVQLTVVFKDQPSSQEAVDAVGDVRDICKGFKSTHLEMWDASVYIGGTSANSADIGKTVSEDFPLSAALVMVGVYMILLFVLGSVLIPIRLMITILLSIAWTLALGIMIFIWWAGIPILWILPLLLFVILMGLGMDYDIFLMTRVKEEVMKGKSDEEAIAHAVERTGSIITICGVIMAGAFGTMMLSSMGLLQEFGFGLCFAILIDATIVRIYLVPAIMILLKKWNWWAPFGLQKVRRK
jgi:putative drug exporter of the RND superfamily